MNWKRFQHPSFATAAVNSCLLLILIAISIVRWKSASITIEQNVLPFLEQLRSSLQATEDRIAQLQSASSTDEQTIRSSLTQLQSSLQATENRIAQLEQKLDSLQDTISPASDTSDADMEGTFELHSKQDASDLIAGIGQPPSAEALANQMAIIDEWVASPEDADALASFKTEQLTVLRTLVRNEVESLNDQALKADTGAQAAAMHAKGARLLALYPMESSEGVLDEARILSSRHSEVGLRIDVIRRQRYNAWAMARIDDCIRSINSIASSFKSSDNPRTIDATVEHLGKVDPLLLEPVVAQLYNYAIEQAKSNVSPEQQLELGRRMIDPAITRKEYGDF